MIMVHERINDEASYPVLINPDYIEFVCDWNEYCMIRLSSGREVHARESMEEISAMLKEVRK